jgi:ABC-type multidrug transport system fused ATPase/permease subunit
MKYQRVIPVLTPLLIFLLSQSFLWQPKLFFISLTLGGLLIILGVKYIIGRGPLFWPSFIIAPLLFFGSWSVYAAVIVGNFWIQMIFLMILWFLFSYLRTLYYYIVPGPGQTAEGEKFDNLLISGGFLTAFAAAAVLLDLPAFLNWPLYIMLPIWAVVIWLLLIQFKPFKVGQFWPAGALTILSTLVLTELAWVISLLPLNFNISALFLAIAYYLCLMIIRLQARGNLNRRALQLPLILSALAILLIFLTARWL